METLTKAEERVMQILWDLEKSLVKDIIEKMPDPKPPYNTVSTIVRILEKKGFVHYKAYGRTHEYFPIVSKSAYRKFAFKKILINYFGGAYKNVVSFMVENDDLSDDEISDLKKLIDENKD